MPGPVLVYDDRCSFCRRAAGWARLRVPGLEVVGYAKAVSALPGLSPAGDPRAVCLHEPDGSVLTGAAAVFRALSRRPGGSRTWRFYRSSPFFRAASEAGYRFFARHRGWVSGLTDVLCGSPPEDL